MKIALLDDDEKYEIGSNIKRLREEKGILQKDMVAKLHLKGIETSIYHYNKLEHGNRNASVKILFALCDILDCDMNTLFDWKNK